MICENCNAPKELPDHTDLLRSAVKCLRAAKQNYWQALNYAKAGDTARVVELLEAITTNEMDSILERALEKLNGSKE